MKILIINGSPHPEGTSALLLQEFSRGALDKGHCIETFHAAKEELSPCRGCDYCRSRSGNCIYMDSMVTLAAKLLETDMVVLVTPLYYFGMSAQIKMVIDRLYAVNPILRAKPKKAALIATCGDKDDWAFDALKIHYDIICKYLKWESVGQILANGVYYREDIEDTVFPKEAYKFGFHL